MTLRDQLEASLKASDAEAQVSAALERAAIAYKARAYRVAYRHLKRAMDHIDTLVTLEQKGSP